MNSVAGRRVVVTGGSRGIGLGIVEALVARNALVTVIARDATRLAEVASRLGVNTISGDVADESLARNVLREVRPSVLVLNAGVTPPLGPIDQLSWEEFERPWQIDAKASFYWVKQAITQPLPPGSRVILGSSGAARNGSPLSGGYAAAKRAQWLMAQYANYAIKGRDLGLHFQAILPLQILADTALGQSAGEAYAKQRGITLQQFFDGFGARLTPRMIGEHVHSILTDEQYGAGVAYGIKGDSGIVSLDG